MLGFASLNLTLTLTLALALTLILIRITGEHPGRKVKGCSHWGGSSPRSKTRLNGTIVEIHDLWVGQG